MFTICFILIKKDLKNKMHIQKAISENLIEIMYLLRQCTEDFNKNNIYQWNISYPDTDRLIKEIENGSLYLMINKGVPIATITFDEIRMNI